MKKWSNKEEEKLLDLLKSGLTYKDISIKLNRSNRSIKEKTNRLGYNSNSFSKKIEKKCLECGEIFKVSDRNKRDNKRKFCSNSCSATYNNKNRDREIYDRVSLSLSKNKKEIVKGKIFCLYCGKGIKRHRKYCNHTCMTNYEYEEYVNKWKNGNKNGSKGGLSISNYIRKYLFIKYDNKCSKCGWGELNEFTGKIPLEVEHIDGNHMNNKEDNLVLLCPNCHSLTKTYKGANKGNGRYERMKKYYDGKSY